MKEQTLLSTINKEIATCDRKIAECKEKLTSNFKFHFEWGYPELQFHYEYKNQRLKEHQDFITHSPERAEEWLEHNISSITEELLRGDYRQSSTNQFSNMAYAIKKEVNAELLKTYKIWLKWLKEGMNVVAE